MLNLTESMNRSSRGTGYKPGAQGIAVPDSYKGDKDSGIIVPGQGKIFADDELPDGYIQTRNGIIHRDVLGGVVAKSPRIFIYYNRNAQGSSVAAGVAAPVSSAPVSAVPTNAASTSQPDLHQMTCEAVTAFREAAVSVSEHDFMTRLYDAMYDTLNERFRKEGQPTIEECLAAKKDRAAEKGPEASPDDIMASIRRMCRGL